MRGGLNTIMLFVQYVYVIVFMGIKHVYEVLYMSFWRSSSKERFYAEVLSNKVLVQLRLSEGVF